MAPEDRGPELGQSRQAADAAAPYDALREAKGALKVTCRGLALVALGALLLQFPYGTAWLAVPAAILAFFVFVFAFAGLLFASAIWRSLLWNRLKPAQGRLSRALLTGAALLPLLALAVGIYWAVGAVVGE
jgi:hypothetical protein